MFTSKSHPRRRRRSLQADPLENRALLTGGAGNTFALMPGTIAPDSGMAEVAFQIQEPEFQKPSSGRIVLGIDVTPQRESDALPQIQSVVRKTEGAPQQQLPNGRTRPRPQPRLPMFGHPMSTASLVQLGGGRRAAANNAPEQFGVKVQGMNNTSGDFIVGYYLPGDADGNGIVDQADTALVRDSLGATVQQENYNFDADANRDGMINFFDMALTRINRGAQTKITPILTANLDPESTTGETGRVTENDTVRFEGQASPGATITFDEVADRVPDMTTVVRPDGTYRIQAQVAPGVNVFKVSASDSFGQTISGQISPVFRTVEVPS